MGHFMGSRTEKVVEFYAAKYGEVINDVGSCSFSYKDQWDLSLTWRPVVAVVVIKTSRTLVLLGGNFFNSSSVKMGTIGSSGSSSTTVVQIGFSRRGSSVIMGWGMMTVEGSIIQAGMVVASEDNVGSGIRIRSKKDFFKEINSLQKDRAKETKRCTSFTTTNRNNR